MNGIRFDSKREAKRYQELCLLEKAGGIAKLELQPRFPLVVNGEKITSYRADFRYLDVRSGEIVVEDAKGVKTPVYRLKKKLVRAIYGIDIQEV